MIVRKTFMGKTNEKPCIYGSALRWISEIYPPTIHDSPETASFIHICRLRLYQYGRIGDSGSTAETQGSGKACRTPLSQPISPTARCFRTFIGAFRGPFITNATERADHGTTASSHHHHRICGRQSHAIQQGWHAPCQFVQNGEHQTVFRQSHAAMEGSSHHMDHGESVPEPIREHLPIVEERRAGYRDGRARHGNVGRSERQTAVTHSAGSQRRRARP